MKRREEEETSKGHPISFVITFGLRPLYPLVVHNLSLSSVFLQSSKKMPVVLCLVWKKTTLFISIYGFSRFSPFCHVKLTSYLVTS